jgi:hypothetical protein
VSRQRSRCATSGHTRADAGTQAEHGFLRQKTPGIETSFTLSKARKRPRSRTECLTATQATMVRVLGLYNPGAIWWPTLCAPLTGFGEGVGDASEDGLNGLRPPRQARGPLQHLNLRPLRALPLTASFRGSLCFASLSAKKYGTPYFSARQSARRPAKSSESFPSADKVNNTVSVPMAFDVKRLPPPRLEIRPPYTGATNSAIFPH